MELEGLKRVIQFFTKVLGFGIGTIETHHRRQIAKWIQENVPLVKHLYDI